MIETVYRLQVFFDTGKRTDLDKLSDALIDGAASVTELHGVPSKAAVYMGCPAAGPYITVEHHSFNAMADLERQLEALIRQHGGKVI